MEKESIEKELKNATDCLLKMVKISCWNKISNNTSYIISQIENDTLNDFERRKKRKLENDKKNPESLKKVSNHLKSIYENLYDINLYIYRSRKENTIIEIQYYPKSSLESEFYETVKNNEPMLHMKIRIPPYLNNKNEKYDVNWELGGIRYELNLFLSKLKFKWKYRNLIKNVG